MAARNGPVESEGPVASPAALPVQGSPHSLRGTIDAAPEFNRSLIIEVQIGQMAIGPESNAERCSSLQTMSGLPTRIRKAHINRS